MRHELGKPVGRGREVHPAGLAKLRALMVALPGNNNEIAGSYGIDGRDNVRHQRRDVLVTVRGGTHDENSDWKVDQSLLVLQILIKRKEKIEIWRDGSQPFSI